MMINFFKKIADKVNSVRFKGYDFNDIVEKEISDLKKNIIVLEIGCNTRPLIDKSIYKKITLHGIDVDDNIDLKNIKDNFDYFKIISIEDFKTSLRYDLIILDCVLEHVENNDIVFNKLSSLLKENGIILTNQPNSFHPFSIINRLLNQEIKIFILKKLRPWSDVGSVTGWKSYYDKCSYSSFNKLSKDNNLKIIDAKFNYNASDYFVFFPPLFILIVIYEEFVRLFKFKKLCSNFSLKIIKA